ncbi:MAG: dihydrofolate reductase [Bacteroidales bacterium]|nr:dihydrofolate reductase [Bacteroidales bacterium]
MIDPNPRPNLSLIVAMAENRAIGKDNDLLWHLSGDLRRFKQLTTGHPVVMGRRTWESLPKRPLPGRQNIVMTQNPGFAAEGATVVHSINGLFHTLKDCDDEAFVMGGAAIYKALLPFCNRLYVTEVYRDYDADVYFPAIDRSEFTLVRQSVRLHDDASALDYAYLEYDRKYGR